MQRGNEKGGAIGPAFFVCMIGLCRSGVSREAMNRDDARQSYNLMSCQLRGFRRSDKHLRHQAPAIHFSIRPVM